MLKLSDFYQPLNILTISYFIGLFISFDVFGTYVRNLFAKDEKIDSDVRLVDWLIGLSFFVFAWFLAGFLIEANRTNLLISLALFLFVSLPSYIKGKKYLALMRLVKPLFVPILLILPFLPSTFVKASLPPYYSDEMAYHFISPYALLHQLKSFWVFNGGLYANFPRTIDNLYILSFSLTHTYSVVRLMQFSILITSLMFAFLYIKKMFGKMAAFLFFLIFLSMPLALPFTATIGYTDVPAYSFMLVGFLFGIGFLLGNKKEDLILSVIFWAISVGTKYTTFMPFVVYVVVFSVFYWFKNRTFKKVLDRKLLTKIILAFVIMGGYWYIKNFIYYGNPIYPFFFHCWGKYAADCAAGSSFFGTWTTPVTISTLIPIIKELLPGNRVLYFALAISPTLVLLFGTKKARLMVITLLALFGVEMLVLKYFSGFYVRYQQHLEFPLILSMVLIASVKFKNGLVEMIKYGLLLVLAVSCISAYLSNIKQLNSLRFVNWDEINYSTGNTNIYDWIRKRIPNTAEATIWCENPPQGPIALARFDPDMIWYSDSGFMRSYLMNCYYENPSLSSDISTIISVAKQKKVTFWTVTINPCKPADQVKSQAELDATNNTPEEIASELQMRRLNNVVVCNSQEILPNLYYFNYQTIK